MSGRFEMKMLSPRARGVLLHRHVGHDIGRARVLRELRVGEVGRRDICDANPHLVSSAEVLGSPADGPCPVCGADSVRIIHWIHGVGLGEKSGTARNVNEIRSVVDAFLDANLGSMEAGSAGEMSIHTVEVCLNCKWNYLLAEDILQVQESQIPHHLTNDTHELELD